MVSTVYRVAGMTCGHCVSAVTNELSAIEGVDSVSVDLHAGSISTVTMTSLDELSDDKVEAALDEAGDYHLAGSTN